ncbi:hypothetical protein AB0G97_09915 [Streptomyces sp. NPDC020755]|nr:hypothetical protein [Streptomyces sp. VB1]UZI32913.1 hypothetical protein OH133_35160 [Streptomyces sp. VB1]
MRTRGPRPVTAAFLLRNAAGLAGLAALGAVAGSVPAPPVAATS